MGSMVDILGVGVIIRGESGIGKSECVLALIERGYSLVADDVTKVTLVDARTSSARARTDPQSHGGPRHWLINVADVRRQEHRTEKRVDLVVTLKSWHDVPDVDRLAWRRIS